MLRKSLSWGLALLLTNASYAQSVTGAWYGKADVIAQGTNNNYLAELVLRQKGTDVEGIFAYYFKDSYQSFFVRGTYDKETREVSIRNLPMLLYASTSRDGIECPMHFVGTLLVSQVKSSLTGSFYSNEKYKYTCPEIRVNFAMDAAAGSTVDLLRNSTVGKKFWQPQEEDLVVKRAEDNKPLVMKADVSNTKVGPVAPVAINLSKDAEKKLVATYESRKKIYNKDLEIVGDSVRISFYDNGDVDGDIISVFLDKNPVLIHQPLTDRGTNIYLALDTTKEINELGMFAENLGKLPPNTALMVVTDGVNRYEVFLSSDLKQNAAVRLKRKKIEPVDPHRIF